MRAILRGVISNLLANMLAVLLLEIMFLLAFFSAQKDALTFDELAHIPAGYSYLTQQDYRINPEHPPLAKDIAAAPLFFLNLNFPSQSQNWLQDAGAPPRWVQFDLGTEFLYRSDNNPKEIILFSRLPMILLTLLLGAFLFFWTKKLLGNAAALAALALFAFSPSFLAHGRLVTTDVASALGIFVAIYYWIKFLKQPTKTKIAKAGAALAFALLLKFSEILLLPICARNSYGNTTGAIREHRISARRNKSRRMVAVLPAYLPFQSADRFSYPSFAGLIRTWLKYQEKALPRVRQSNNRMDKR